MNYRLKYLVLSDNYKLFQAKKMKTPTPKAFYYAKIQLNFASFNIVNSHTYTGKKSLMFEHIIISRYWLIYMIFYLFQKICLKLSKTP